MRDEPARRGRRGAWALGALIVGLSAASCGRSGLDAEDLQWVGGVEEPGGPDAALPDSAPPGTGGAASSPDGDSPGSSCVPSGEETCNGADDDCNGQTDELPPIACQNGGEQYCVAGSWSACPKPCEACMPGAERICFLSYCKYWAVQTCTADGKSFGKCHEEDPPPECKSVAKNQKYSKALEQCCLDNGYCCLDEFDLDADGNDNEMLGDCEEVLCEP